ncbi:MAG: TatD family hydrolase [Chthoniobacter sp.]|uniref:TatD family hydrolase n=1 Tax=Chthoniobacter sp. TaxID=2510640 RepID=UPI0032A2DCEC
MLFDTHAHLDFPDFSDDLDAVLARAEAAGITRINTIGTSVEGSRRAVELAEKYPNVYAVIGVHPNSAVEAGENFIEELRILAQSPRVVAIGEAGLDYHRLPSKHLLASKDAILSEMPLSDPMEPTAAVRDGAIKTAQAIVFEQQLDLAVELGLNIVIHERDAWEDTLALLRPYTGKLRAVFHCFGKPPVNADELLDLEHVVSFTGIVTFKNAADAQETARQVPPDSFMFETDCPFLAPVPFRGKRCEPAYTRQVAECVAQLRGESFADLAARTSRNAAAFFRYPD